MKNSIPRCQNVSKYCQQELLPNLNFSKICLYTYTLSKPLFHLFMSKHPPTNLYNLQPVYTWICLRSLEKVKIIPKGHLRRAKNISTISVCFTPKKRPIKNITPKVHQTPSTMDGLSNYTFSFPAFSHFRQVTIGVLGIFEVHRRVENADPAALRATMRQVGRREGNGIAGQLGVLFEGRLVGWGTKPFSKAKKIWLIMAS